MERVAERERERGRQGGSTLTDAPRCLCSAHPAPLPRHPTLRHRPIPSHRPTVPPTALRHRPTVLPCHSQSEWREAMGKLKKRSPVEAALLEEMEGRAAAVEAKEARVDREAKKRKLLDEPRRISNRQQVCGLRHLRGWW